MSEEDKKILEELFVFENPQFGDVFELEDKNLKCVFIRKIKSCDEELYECVVYNTLYNEIHTGVHYSYMGTAYNNNNPNFKIKRKIS